ncbi:hypothetical protein [Dermacoccus nishinomiyaensis]|uniref:hypothetical protein n=1 Tax=Dermacoccus nishinomiyaensis TaxID=1274 RepID=UPI001EF60262|nr:hypothetical protein [Dermacoccus nishinomiyaensis]MCG7429036.1 hypothetical protein [Dermacoccus nishinomiyaensis]
MTKKQLTEEPMTEDLTNETDERDTAPVSNETPETGEQERHLEKMSLPDAPAEPADEGVTGEDVTVDTSYVEDEAEDATEGVTTTDTPEDDAETFPREYVEKLRKEAADARVKAKRADDLAARLHTALVAATGRLADPSDLPFDDAHLEDADALNAAVDALLARKPHLASRRPVGSIGQGATSPADRVSLAGILRHNAI